MAIHYPTFDPGIIILKAHCLECIRQRHVSTASAGFLRSSETRKEASRRTLLEARTSQRAPGRFAFWGDGGGGQWHKRCYSREWRDWIRIWLAEEWVEGAKANIYKATRRNEPGIFIRVKALDTWLSTLALTLLLAFAAFSFDKSVGVPNATYSALRLWAELVAETMSGWMSTAEEILGGCTHWSYNARRPQLYRALLSCCLSWACRVAIPRGRDVNKQRKGSQSLCCETAWLISPRHTWPYKGLLRLDWSKFCTDAVDHIPAAVGLARVAEQPSIKLAVAFEVQLSSRYGLVNIDKLSTYAQS